MIGRRQWLLHCCASLMVWAACLGTWASVSAQSRQALEPVELVRNISSDVRQRLIADSTSHSLSRAEVVAIVNTLVIPNVDTAKMTASAMGRYWRRASPSQKVRLQEEFVSLVVHTYAGALLQFKNQTINVLPARVTSSAKQVVVKTEVHGDRQPLRIDYRLIKTPEGWKIYDFSVASIWLTLNYRSSFSRIISTSGIDGLISKLAEKNRANRGD